MIISFFEEFPTQENLAKLKFVDWKSKLYLAAPSFSEFKRLSTQIKQKNITKLVYWPILERKEGYWISPFSKREALERVFHELQNEEAQVMLDLELPTTRNPWLYITELPHFRKNKSFISNFTRERDCSLAEYYCPGKWTGKVLELFGLHFPSKDGKIIKMIYHSMHPFHEDSLKKELGRSVTNLGKRFLLGLGTIAVGVLGNEPLLKPEDLRRDLKLARDLGVEEVVIFRLGGLTREYTEVCKEFC